MATTYRIGGWFGLYSRASIPGYFAIAVLLVFLGVGARLVSIAFVCAATNALTTLFVISIRTVVDAEGVQQLSLRRRPEKILWEAIARGVLVDVKDLGDKSTSVPGLRLHDGSEIPLGRHVGRRQDGERETLLERVGRKLDSRSVPRDW